MRNTYRKVLLELGRENKNIFTVDADAGGYVADFAREFPERVIKVGIAEQNLVSVGAGLASTGKIVFIHTMAGFVSRTCEQIKLDIAWHNSNVKIVTGFRGVLSTIWGTTHHALEAIAMMRSIPKMVIVLPADSLEAEKTIRAAVDYYGPMYISLGVSRPVYEEDYRFELGKAVHLRDGDDIAIIATGSMVGESLKAAEVLSQSGVDARVINVHTIKPIDEDIILKSSKETKMIVTVEEQNVIGGLGSAVAEVVSEKAPTIVKRIGFQDTFCDFIGNYRDTLEKFGLTAPIIATKIKDFLARETV